MLEIGKTYSCKVVKILKTYMIVKTENTTGIVHISQISDYHIDDITKIFNVGSSYMFLLIDIKGGKYTFSYKQLNPKLLKIRNSIIPTLSGFKNVLSDLINRLNKDTK
ncbi:MAG: S1 RNA-binding domain-containing protein [Mycoplasmataceae bacterium]|jgi:general stress protein 13|nr:S1 RNA-binding domain-containing protein [Mycoplasmataceae bacterium]